MTKEYEIIKSYLNLIHIPAHKKMKVIKELHYIGWLIQVQQQGLLETI